MLNIALIDADGNLSLKPGELDVYQINTHTIPADQPRPADRIDVIVICASDPEHARELADLHAGKAKGRPPVILISDTVPPPDGFDGWLRRPVSPVQLANRVQSLRRLWVMEDVARRRRAAVEVFGHPVTGELQAEKRPTVLFVGDATSRFMAIRHALNASDTGMIAAFSSFSAFDYLHERPFDAVILNAINKKELAFVK